MINIVAAFDDCFAQHARVMIQSILESNQQQLRFYLLVPEDFSQENNFLEDKVLSRCAVELIYFPRQLVSQLNVSGHVSEATYYRLLMGQLLPQQLERVLYLDCDLIVQGSIQPLWEADLRGHVIAAAVDDYVNSDRALKHRLSMEDGALYFNAGVMLIDLDKWRQQSVGEQALAFCTLHPDQITYWDQCSLNAHFNGRFVRLPRNWNAQSCLFEREGGVATLAREADIIHFNTVSKPWHEACQHPMSSLYWKALKNTPYYNRSQILKRSVKPYVRPLLPAFRMFRNLVRG